MRVYQQTGGAGMPGMGGMPGGGMPGGMRGPKKEVDNKKYYDLLGVEKGASDADIKKARKLGMQRQTHRHKLFAIWR